MKKLILLLLFVSGYSQAQIQQGGTVITLPDFSKFVNYSDLNTVKSDVSNLNKKINAQQKTIDSLKAVKGDQVVVVPQLDTCKRGPKITGISAISSTSITPKFDGENVTHIKYTVTGNGVSIVDSLKPENNQPVIKFPVALLSGTYTLTFEGLNCTGKSTRQFTVSSDTSPPVVVVPPVVNTPDCSKKITFQILNISSIGVNVKFDAENLKTLTLSLLSNANLVLKSTTYNPESNTLYFPFNTQNPGDYKIRLTPIDCNQIVEDVPFSIRSAESGTKVPVIDNSTRQGVLEYKNGSKTFGVINGRNSNITITSDGKVKLNVDKNKQSFSGRTKLNLMVFNSMMGQIKGQQLEELTTTGSNLIDGNYIFYLYWFDPKYGDNIENVKANWWEAAGSPDTFRDHSGQYEMVSVDVRDVNYTNNNEIRPPSDVWGSTWYDDYQLTPYTINTNSPKKFGITKRVEQLTPDQVLTQATHLQMAYGDVNHIVSYDKTWSNLRAYQRAMIYVPYTGTLVAGATTYAEADSDVREDDIIGIHSGAEFNTDGISVSFKILRQGRLQAIITNNSGQTKTISGNAKCQIFDSIDKQVSLISYISSGHIVMSEMCENGIPFDIVEEIFKRSSSRFGLPKNHSYISDYFANINNWGTDLATKKPSEIRKLFSSVDSARYNQIDGSISYYYQNKAYLYRNRFANGYLTGVSELTDRVWFHTANLEKQFIAMPDIKVLVYGTNMFEGINSEMERNGVWTRLPFEKGDVVRLAQGEASFEQIKFEVLIGRILANYHISWHDNGFFGKYAANWNTAWYGGPALWKTLYNPKGTDKYFDYNINDPSQIQPDKSLGIAAFNPSIATGGNGGFAGALLFDQIEDRLDKSIRWPVFSYSDNSGYHTGYYNGVNPVMGEKGAEYSRYGLSNPRQHNIANQFEFRKPIIMFCEGKAGIAVFVVDPTVGLTEKRTYEIKENGRTFSFTHTGPAVGVYKF